MAVKKGQGASMYAGESRAITVTMTTAAGASVNMTGASAKWVLATCQNGTTLLTKDVGLAAPSTMTVSGCTCSFDLVEADTDGLEGTGYWSEMECVDTSGSTWKALTGTWKILRGRL